MPECFGASGSVRAPTQYHSAKCAEVVHVFWPFSTQPSTPSCSVRVAFNFIDAASEPASGSLYPTANSTCASRICREELLLELVAADADERLADDPDALADLRPAPPRERFVEQELVDSFAVLPAVLLRPGDAEPPAVGQLLHERAPRGRVDDLGHVLAGDVEHVRIVVGVQEGAHVVGERTLLGGKIEVHRALRHRI